LRRPIVLPSRAASPFAASHPPEGASQGALLDGWTAGATGGVNFLGTDRQETFQQEMVGNTAVETAGAMLELVDDPVPSPPPPRGTLPDGKVRNSLQPPAASLMMGAMMWCGGRRSLCQGHQLASVEAV
jgi:hypothetical protein